MSRGRQVEAENLNTRTGTVNSRYGENGENQWYDSKWFEDITKAHDKVAPRSMSSRCHRVC